MLAHSAYMQRCIELAQLGAGKVSPNPMVGSLIVCDGKILAEGYHMKYGEAHAEVNAINQVVNHIPDGLNLLKKSTVYVNLEPCAHTGKTPPCADLIIKYGIPNVVLGCQDSNAHVNGLGIKRMQDHGVKVLTDVLKENCLHLNRRFFTRITKQRPYIILKWAQTRDGYFAPSDGSKKWISSDLSKQLVHKWRSEEDAVLVGKNTALADNPRLNVRLWEGRNPLRIVVDRNLELPITLNIFDESQDTLIFNSQKTLIDGRNKFLELENLDTLMPQMIAYQLYLMDIQSVLIEGGAQILNQFLSSGMWDEIRRFTSSESWQAGIEAPQLRDLPHESSKSDKDDLEIWYNTTP